MKKIYVKTFDFKGQAINYYNKVKTNNKIKVCTMSFDMVLGWTVVYNY